MEIEGTCASKNFDETVCLQSEKREEWIRETTGERLQGNAEGASSASHLANSSAASFPGRNECPGTKCSLIKQKREYNSCQRDSGKRKGEERTEWRGQNESQIEEEKRNGRFVGAAETSKKRAEWRRLQQRSLNILGMLRRKECPPCHTESSWQVRQSHLCQKEQGRQFRVPDRERAESQGEREPHLGEKGRNQSNSMKRRG